MKKYIYSLYALWAAVATTWGILSKNYWLLTSWVWFPVFVLLVLAVSLALFVDVATVIRNRKEKDIKDSCDTCLFAKSAQYSEDKKCIGCIMDENHTLGELCKYYRRHLSDDK